MKYTRWFLFVMVICFCSTALSNGSGLSSAVAFLIDREPGHPKKGNVEYASEIGQAIDSAANQYQVDPWVLTSMGSWESHFRPDILSLKKKGKAGEAGLLQCGKLCAARCPHFLDTVKGQAQCGAFWLDVARTECQTDDIVAALTYYASGEVCDAKLYKPKRCLEEEDTVACYKKAQGNLRAKVRRRINLADKLKNNFSE